MPCNDGDDSLCTFARQTLDLIAEQANSNHYDGIPDGKGDLDLKTIIRPVHEDHASQLSSLCSTAHQGMRRADKDSVQSYRWRRLYTDASLVWAMLDCLDLDARPRNNDKLAYWRDIVARLDTAIIVSGCPGSGRYDLVLQTIHAIQSIYLPLGLDTADSETSMPLPSSREDLRPSTSRSARAATPIFAGLPSLSSFQSKLCKKPFVLKSAASDWPAIVEDRKWASKRYLQGIAGRGRVVPIEVGEDYRSDDWTQRIESWDDFLDYLFNRSSQNRTATMTVEGKRDVRYLAQHSLFSQFPSLRDDIIIPDYVYASLSPPDDFPSYQPPGNEEQLVINTWIGPKGTISPAHTDPYYNFYTQVVGSKTVWLAPPSVTPCMVPFSASPGLDVTSHAPPTSMLANTSSLDVFTSSSFPHSFNEIIAPVAQCVTLNEGDVLFFPPGWWHAMRAESASISVSMWF